MDEWFYRIPRITQIYLTGIFLTTLGCQLNLINKYQLFFTWKLFWNEKQYWRIISTYLYFGRFSIDTMFHLYFLLQYCHSLEEESFRGKRADFIYFIILSIISITGLAVIFDLTSEIPFLSSSLTFTLTYLWSRRNPTMRMSFLGLFTFNAPYLPFTLIGFTLILHSHIPWADMLGMVVGHTYYFLEDVYPTLSTSGGFRPLKTPDFLVNLFAREDEPVEVLPDLQMEQLENEADGGN